MDPWPFPPERSDGYIQRLWASFNVDQKRSYLNEKEAAASANMVGESTGNADEPQPKRHREGENAGRMRGGRNRGGIGRGATPGQTKVRARQDHRLSGGPESTPARPPLEHSQTNIPIDPRLTRADEHHGVTSVSAGSRYSTPFRTRSVPAQPTSSRSISRSSSPDLDLASVTSQARQGRVHLPSEPCKDSGPTPSSDDSQIEQGSTYKTQVDDKAASRRLKNEQRNRWRERRGQKKDWRLQAVNTFTDKYGVDPTPLLVQDYMSDEASDSPEDKDIWKRRVMNYGGLEGKLEDHRVLEIVRPEWRDEATSEIYHELSKIRMTSLSAKSRQQILFHRYWFKTKRVWKYKRETEDWGHYGDDHTPPGFPMPDGLRLLQMDEENDAQGFP
ncbi:hypothetical protein JB92DRAFT_2828563 [Gautieria morchelliformis]|nr:hypothetical protein JB92DRAFT_2828563 [Gautieria morchelliformis]